MVTRVFCAGAVKAAMMQLAPEFENEAGERLQFSFGAVGSLKARVLAGEPVDVLILSRPALEQLERDGKLLAHAISDLGRVGVGIAVRAGAALPALSTPQALRASLLAAASISYGDPASGDSSGVHFARVLERLAIQEQVEARTLLAASGLAVAALVQQGKAQLGATQASVISSCEGIALAGLLPPALQPITTYSSGIAAHATTCDAARRFLAYLGTACARSRLDQAGIQR